MNKETPLGDHSFNAKLKVNLPAAIVGKAVEMLDAKVTAMAVKLQANLTGKTTFATLPLRRIAEVLTGGSALLARKDAH